MEIGMMMEVEDDVFFADLNRQISLLITDEEDEHAYYSPPISTYPTAVSIQTLSRTATYQPTQPHYYQFDQTSYTPDQSKGTGVFIPKSSQFSSRRRTKHQITKTSNNNNYNSYNSNNYKSSYRQPQQLPSQVVFAQFMTPKNC